MALTKRLAETTLRELLDELALMQLRDAAQLREAIARTLGLQVDFNLAASLQIAREEERDAALAGRGFAGFVTQAGAAGNNAHVQLFNPSTSARRLIIHGLVAEPSAASVLHVRDHLTPLATLDAAPGARLLGGPASVAELRRQNQIAVLGAPLVSISEGLRPEVLTMLSQRAALIIPPARGVTIVPAVQAVDCTAFFLWEEAPL